MKLPGFAGIVLVHMKPRIGIWDVSTANVSYGGSREARVTPAVAGPEILEYVSFVSGISRNRRKKEFETRPSLTITRATAVIPEGQNQENPVHRSIGETDFRGETRSTRSLQNRPRSSPHKRRPRREWKNISPPASIRLEEDGKREDFQGGIQMPSAVIKWGTSTAGVVR